MDKANKSKKVKNKEQKKYEKSQIVIKIIAGILALMMVLAGGATLVFSLI